MTRSTCRALSSNRSVVTRSNSLNCLETPRETSSWPRSPTVTQPLRSSHFTLRRTVSRGIPVALLAPYAYASDPASPELVAATAKAPMDPEEQLDEGLKSFGYLTGLALGCVVAEQRVALETEAIELHAAIARLLGTDRAFLYSSAFGYGPRSSTMPGTARKSSTATTCVSPGFARAAGVANEHACNSVGSGRRDQGGERRLTNRDRAHTGQCRSPCRRSRPGLRYVPAQILKVQCAANLPRGETTPS